MAIMNVKEHNAVKINIITFTRRHFLLRFCTLAW